MTETLAADGIETRIGRGGRRGRAPGRRSVTSRIVDRRPGLEAADVGADLHLCALVLRAPFGTPVLRQLGPGSVRHRVYPLGDGNSPSRRNSFR